MPRQALIGSYLDQIFTTPGGGARPSDPGFVFGIATPRGTVQWDKLHDRRAFTIERLTQLAINATPGWATGSLHSFVEPVAFASGLNMEDADIVAERVRIGTLLARAQEVARVIDRQGTQLADGTERTPTPARVCDMSDSPSGDICPVKGGPFRFKAMNAAIV